MNAVILHAPTVTVPTPNDELNREILHERVAARDAHPGPRVGDFVIYPNDPPRGNIWTEHVERISYDWGDEVQTSPAGSFHLTRGGYSSFSGALNPAIPVADLYETGKVWRGRFWFFDHDNARKDGGVQCEVPCRVWSYSPTERRGG